MSNEISRVYFGSKTPVCMITRLSDTRVWSFSSNAWETYNAVNIDNYDLILVESGAPNIFFADFPEDIAAGTKVMLNIYERQGATFATSDLEFLLNSQVQVWDGGDLSDDSVSGTLTNIQKVRLRIGDWASAIFTDDQISDFLSENDSDIFASCADACLALAADNAKLARLVEMSNYVQDTRSIAKEYRLLADYFRQKSDNKPAIGISSSRMSSDPNFTDY